MTYSAFNSASGGGPTPFPGGASSWNGTDAVYTAILSDSTTNANDRFSILGKVFNTQFEKVADDSTDFWDGFLDAAIQYDEYGVSVGSSEVWSGSTSLGNYSGQTCSDWTDAFDVGDVGATWTSGSIWLLSHGQSCSDTARLYGISPAITAPVPEPSTFILFATGLASVCGYQWRRRRGK